jgi:hypothetical protein
VLYSFADVYSMTLATIFFFMPDAFQHLRASTTDSIKIWTEIPPHWYGPRHHDSILHRRGRGT